MQPPAIVIMVGGLSF